jgi:hypothetical protein
MQKHTSDFPAAITGFLVGAVLLLAMVIATVAAVNASHSTGSHATPGASH